MADTPYVYSLTPLTGSRRNENRRTVIMTVEVKRRTLLVSIAALLASLPVVGMLFTVIGASALVAVPVMIAAALWLWDSRQRRGLQLLNAQAILDTRKAHNNVLYVAGAEMQPPSLVMHQRQTILSSEDAPHIPVVDTASNVPDLKARTSSARRQKNPGNRYQ